MANPTIYRYPTQIIRKSDDTITEVERTLRQNGDVSMIVKVKDAIGHHLVVYHRSRDPTYDQPFPPDIGRQP